MNATVFSVRLAPRQTPRTAIVMAYLFEALAERVPDMLRRRDLAAALVQGMQGAELEDLDDAARAVVRHRREVLGLTETDVGAVAEAMSAAWRVVTT